MTSKLKQIELIRAKIDFYEGRLRASFLLGINNIKMVFTLAEFQQAAQDGSYSAIVSMITPIAVAESFLDFTRLLQDAFQAGGDIEGMFAQPLVRFDMAVTESNTARFLQGYRATKIAEITQDLRTTISQIIQDGVNRGENPKEIARRVRAGLGLTGSQEQAVQNYRRALENLEGNALRRGLRDRRYDATVRRAMERAQRMTPEQIEKMTQRYQERYLKYRSQTIARTEAMRMVNSGQRAYWQQAIDEGKVESTRLRRFWQPTYDEKLREWHRTIPTMNKDGVEQDQPFKSELGPIMYPGDPSAPAANVINCRCTVITRITTED